MFDDNLSSILVLDTATFQGGRPIRSIGTRTESIHEDDKTSKRIGFNVDEDDITSITSSWSLPIPTDDSSAHSTQSNDDSTSFDDIDDLHFHSEDDNSHELREDTTHFDYCGGSF